MSMSKKNYEMVAGVLRLQVENAQTVRLIEEDNGLDEHLVSNAVGRSLSSTAYNLVQKFKDDNERFDHIKFYEACGFIIHGNYPYVFLDNAYNRV